MSAFITGPLQKAFHNDDLDELPAPPPEREPSPMAAQPKAPDALPGDKDRANSATLKDERRRILGAMPNSTKKTYAGEAPGADAVVKKRVLGSGNVGQTTTGG